MLNPSDHLGHFITLLAHDSDPALQVLQLPNINGNRFVKTSASHETATAIESKRFNLIIIDVTFNGVELASVEKSSHCINFHTPRIALFDEADEHHRRSLITAGFDDCLLKPLTTDKLNDIITLWRGNDVLTSSFSAIQDLLRKIRNNNGLALTLYTKFFDELPPQIKCIEDALKNENYKLAFDVTHKLNGAALICCLQYIKEPASALEKCLIQIHHDHAEMVFLMLQQRISVFISHRELILNYLMNTQ
ncbi:MAG: Hpt domain-containing protein [Proteobacteria bacterium]|nr:Hpt domain-containing protein [Pseudomonadota bacterium]